MPRFTIWHALNHLIAGHVVARELLIASVCALLLAGVLRLMARSITALDDARARETGRDHSPSHGGQAHG